jgi:hypothetical protein
MKNHSKTNKPLLEQGLFGNESNDKQSQLKDVGSTFGARWICTDCTGDVRSAIRAYRQRLDVIR